MIPKKKLLWGAYTENKQFRGQDLELPLPFSPRWGFENHDPDSTCPNILLKGPIMPCPWLLHTQGIRCLEVVVME
jgi:hypothetical protein